MSNYSLVSLRNWVKGQWEGNTYVPKAVSACGQYCNTTNLQFHDLERAGYNIYSSGAALECLVSRYEDIAVFGDSYMRNLYKGIQDVLSGVLNYGPSSKVVQDDQGTHLDPGKSASTYTTTFQASPRSIKVSYYRMFGIDLNILRSVSISPKTLVIFGSMVHDHKFGAVDKLIKATSKKHKAALLNDKDHPGRKKYRRAAHAIWMSKIPDVLELFRSNKFIWVTSPYYETSKVQLHSAEAAINQVNARYFLYNLEGVNKVLAAKDSMFLDCFHLTKTCVFNNCSEDGAHRASFVNRMKFHIILNAVCRSSL